MDLCGRLWTPMELKASRFLVCGRLRTPVDGACRSTDQEVGGRNSESSPSPSGCTATLAAPKSLNSFGRAETVPAPRRWWLLERCLTLSEPHGRRVAAFRRRRLGNVDTGFGCVKPLVSFSDFTSKPDSRPSFTKRVGRPEGNPTAVSRFPPATRSYRPSEASNRGSAESSGENVSRLPDGRTAGTST